MKQRIQLFFVLALLLILVSPLLASCPDEVIYNYTGGGQVACPCFVEREQAGAVFEAPEYDYPIKITAVGIGWGSVYGGNPAQLEQAIHIYDAGLPSPGVPIFSLLGPQLYDGAINEFDLDILPEDIIIEEGEFTITLEFLNDNAGDIFAPTMVHVGNGCQPGQNVVYAVPGGWNDACALGVTGDWVVYVWYRQAECLAPVEDRVLGSVPFASQLYPCYPNPFNPLTSIKFDLPVAQTVNLSVYTLAGGRVATLVAEPMPAGQHEVTWYGRDDLGRSVGSGMYLYRLETVDFCQTRQMVLLK